MTVCDDLSQNFKEINEKFKDTAGRPRTGRDGQKGKVQGLVGIEGAPLIIIKSHYSPPLCRIFREAASKAAVTLAGSPRFSSIILVTVS